jgi:hypothetical protein
LNKRELLLVESNTSNSKKKKIFPSIWHLLTSIYGILYLLFIVAEILSANEQFNPEGIMVKLLFIVFLIGFYLSWEREGLAGLIFIFWWIGMWYLALFVVEHDRGAGVVMGIPLLIIGIGFIISWYKNKKRINITT